MEFSFKLFSKNLRLQKSLLLESEIFDQKHGPEAGMINRGYHGNDASADPNVVAFVHPPR